jgi:hypothetical protein
MGQIVDPAAGGGDPHLVHQFSLVGLFRDVGGVLPRVVLDAVVRAPPQKAEVEAVLVGDHGPAGETLDRDHLCYVLHG